MILMKMLMMNEVNTFDEYIISFDSIQTTFIQCFDTIICSSWTSFCQWVEAIHVANQQLYRHVHCIVKVPNFTWPICAHIFIFYLTNTAGSNELVSILERSLFGGRSRPFAIYEPIIT
jgi:hypothetical protein